MTALTRRTALVLAASSLLATALPTVGRAEPAEGTAEGTLTVNGKTVKVAYATARQVPGFFDKSTMDTEVIVSDVPLDAKALSDRFVRSDMADAGKLHAFEITIDATGTPISTSWHHNGFTTRRPAAFPAPTCSRRRCSTTSSSRAVTRARRSRSSLGTRPLSI